MFWRILLSLLQVWTLDVTAQIIDAQTSGQNRTPPTSEPPSSQNQDLGAAVLKLTDSISKMSERLQALEDNLHLRLQIFGETITQEKSSIEKLSSRFDNLDQLTSKVDDLNSKIEDETTLMRTALTVTNNDVMRLSTQLEELEQISSHHPFRASKFQSKKDATNDDLRQQGNANSNSSDTGHEERSIGEMVLNKVERALPRLLAAELNHFYLNMATKTDHSMGQLQRDLVARLRRIEATSKKSLSEIQDGRQDTSHLTHLQRTMISTLKISDNSGSNEKCNVELKNDLKEYVKGFPEKVASNVMDAVRNMSRDFTGSVEKQHRDKGGPPSSNTEIWRGIFSSGLSRQSQSHISNPSYTPKQCIDPTTSATLEEVKQLFRSLMSKGEDLRITLTKQAGEGVDLLKLLHQRFSVLLRRINTDPGHGEALLAEVQELEHLVENSYSSILMAQNVFIESCRRIQEEEPSIEGQIVEILNKLVTNIDLGHQFNRKQLYEVRKLIQHMNLEDQSKNISLVSGWIPSNETTDSKNYQKKPPTFNDRLYKFLIIFASEANSTEEKLHGVFDRISEVENELQALNWNSGNVKNIIDELLTRAKDLKGYSRDQIESLQNFQNDVLEFADNFGLHSSISSSPKISQQVDAKIMNNNYNITSGDEYSSNKTKDISNFCLVSVYNTLNSSSLFINSNYTSFNWTNENDIKNVLKQLIAIATSPRSDHKDESFQTLKPTTTTTTIITPALPLALEDEKYFQNVDQFYYDLDHKEMLMDDDHIWNQHYYDDDGEVEEDDSKNVLTNKFQLLLPTAKRIYLNGKYKKSTAKMTMLENDFNIN